MSGLTAFMRSTMLLKSRVGFACLMTSLTSKPKPGKSRASSAAVPVPNRLSSWMIMTVFAGLPATVFSTCRLLMATCAQVRYPGPKRKVFFSPRSTIWSATPTSTTCGRLYLAAACVVARQIAEAYAPTTAEQPASFIFSISAAPVCGVLCASPSRVSIFAPPSDLMPVLLMSSIAISAPSRHCWPEYASAPVTGWRMPTLTGLGCAPPTIGKASAEAAAADCWMKARRFFKEGLLRFRTDDGSVKLCGQLFTDPHFRVDVADTRQLHVVLVAIGSVQALKPLHRALVHVEHEALHGQQRGADVHTQKPRHGDVRQPGRDVLSRPADLHAGLFEQHEERLLAQLSPTEAARDRLRHVGRDVGQRPVSGRPDTHRFLDQAVAGHIELPGDLLRRGQHLELHHLDSGAQTHVDDVLQQPG